MTDREELERLPAGTLVDITIKDKDGVEEWARGMTIRCRIMGVWDEESSRGEWRLEATGLDSLTEVHQIQVGGKSYATFPSLNKSPLYGFHDHLIEDVRMVEQSA